MQTIYLDISNKGVIPTVYAKQNDVGRKFAVILTDSGLPYIPVSGSAFSVWYKGASGEGNYTDIGDKSAFSLNGNKVEVEMIVQMLSAHGDGVLCLTLNSPDGNQISSWNIPYMCEIVPGSESEKAEEYYTAFSESVEKLKQVTENLTPEAIGAAPSGYGLGANAVNEIGYRQVNHEEADALRATTICWFRDDANPFYYDPWASGAAGVLIHIQHNVLNSDAAKQIFIPYYKCSVRDSDGPDSYVIVERTKRNSDGTWTPPEWRNPPMIFGVEYRTTERWNGSPVYVQAVDLGPLPNNKENIVPFKGVASFVVGLQGFGTTSGSFFDLTKLNEVIGFHATRTDIRITTNYNLSTWTGYAIVKYTKN